MQVQKEPYPAGKVSNIRLGLGLVQVFLLFSGPPTSSVSQSFDYFDFSLMERIKRKGKKKSLQDEI